MSRQLDPANLDDDDLAYISQRPMLRQEFIQQGYGDPLSKDYNGLAEGTTGFRDPSDGPLDSTAELDALRVENRELRQEMAQLQEAYQNLESQLEDLQQEDDDDNEQEDGDDNDNEPEPAWNPEMKKAQLQEVIDARNEGRDEDDKIVPDGTNKDDLVSALEEDDEKGSDEEG